MAYVRYNVYSWFPPKLTPEEEIEIGREIVLKGRDFFMREAPYLNEDEQRRAEEAKHYTLAQKLRVGIVGTLFFGPILIFMPRIWVMLVALIPILGLSIGSMLIARATYRRWVDEMIAKYAAHLAVRSSNLPPESENVLNR